MPIESKLFGYMFNSKETFKELKVYKILVRDFHGGAVVKNTPANAGTQV